MPFTAFSHWIFDMDGTLTLPVHDFEAMRQMLDIPAGESILEWIGKQPKKQAIEIHKKLHDIEMELAFKAQPQPDVHVLLETLVAQGKRLGILTRNGKRITEATLQAAAMSDYFDDDFIITRDCCAPKPDSAGVDLLLRRWQATADQTIIVGDYLYDIQAGFNVGVKTLHYDTSSQFPWPEYTDYKASSIKEILHLIV